MVSSRNYPTSKSKYDYAMVAIVHRQAVECSHVLKQVGFRIMIVDTPVQPKDIQGEHLKKYIHRDGCCGHGEYRVFMCEIVTFRCADPY